MLSWLWLSGGAYLGWSLGANDAANVFGTAVATRAVKFATAAFCVCLFVVIGAFLQGNEGIETLKHLSQGGTVQGAFITMFTAALTVTIMTVIGIPVSTSQAVVGSIIGMALAASGKANFGQLPKLFICWVGTPIGAMIISAFFYRVLGPIWDKISDRFDIETLDRYLRIALIIVGSYGAYALGANNIANVVGVFAPFHPFNTLSNQWLGTIGALSICVGVITFGRKVMLTVGNDLVPLVPFTAFIAVLSESITIHIYAMVGVPVSTSQAIVGGVLGIGLIKGVQAVNTKVLLNIVLGWLSTLLISGIFAFLLYKLVFGIIIK